MEKKIVVGKGNKTKRKSVERKNIGWEFVNNILKDFDFKLFGLLFVSGMFTSLGFLMRYPSAISALLIAPYLLYLRRFRDFIAYAIGNGVVLLPWLVYNFIKYSNPLWDLFAQTKIINLYTSFQPISLFFDNLVLSSGIILLFFVVFIYFYVRDKKVRTNFFYSFILWLLILSILYYMFGVGLKLYRYQLMILPFVVLLAFVGLDKLISKIYFSKLFGWIKYSLLLIFFALIFAQSYYQTDLVFDKVYPQYDLWDGSAMESSIDYASYEVPSGEVVISNAWTWYGFYGNHRARSIWDQNISSVLYDVDEGYLFINSYYDMYFDEIYFNGDLVMNFTDEKNNSVLIYHVWK